MAKVSSHPGGSRSSASIAKHGRPTRSKVQPAEAAAKLESLPHGHRDWRRVVALVLGAHNHNHAVRRKGVSHKTMDERGNFYFRFFRELRGTPTFTHVDPRSLADTHVRHFVARWSERGLSTGTIHLYLSYLRVWSRWIGKPGLVRSVGDYGERVAQHRRRDQIARTDHGWQALDFDVQAKIGAVADVDALVGAQLELMARFGLRAKEAICFVPHGAVVAHRDVPASDAAYFPDVAAFVYVRRGTKGGRKRYVPIQSPEQLELIERCKRLVITGNHMGARATVAASRRRFYYVLERCGVTRALLGVVAHGLRHDYANDLFERTAGHPSPVRGGGAGGAAGDLSAKATVARALGHARPQIAGCYIGTSLDFTQEASVTAEAAP